MDTPVISATAKGPNQINLTWAAITNPGWGYLVEIQSDSDSRYAAYTQISATRDGRAWLPYWVTESHYTDITDDSGTGTGTAAQFQMYGLKYGTLYNFRVRCYAQTDAGVAAYGSYSSVATATTTTPATIRYVIAGGAGAQNGTSWANAWPKISSANAVAAGTLVYVRSGTYAADHFNPSTAGTQANRTVIQAEPVAGTVVTITTNNGGLSTLWLDTSYVIVDGINVLSTDGEVRVIITAQRVALANAEIDCNSGGYAVAVEFRTSYSLVHYCYLRRAGTASVDDGDSFAIVGSAYNRNVVQYTNCWRGSHDTGLLQDGPSYNQFKNNLLDGGWGLGWECVSRGGLPICQYNLFEGNVVKDVGQNSTAGAYKPGIEVSGNFNTIRRNVIYNGAGGSINSHGIEVSSFNAGQTVNGNLIYNNVIYKNSGLGIYQFVSVGTGSNNNMANNIIYGNLNAGNDFGDGAPLQTALAGAFAGTVYNNNLILATPGGSENPSSLTCNRNYATSQTTPNANTLYAEWNANVTTTPAMIDPANAEFHLKSTSGLRGVGVSITDAQWGTTGEMDLGAFKWFDPTGAGSTPPAAPTNLRLV